MTLENDTVLRERAGLVRAQHVHGAEVLDGVEALDDDLLPRHRQRTLREIDRNDHRQHLGRQADRHGDREQQRLEPVALGHAIDHEDKRGHHQDETEHHPGEPGDALVEAREHSLLGNRARHNAEGGTRSGEHDDAAADATDDGAAHEADVGEVKRRFRGAGVGSSDLLNRHRFAGERRLVDEEVLRRNQSEVGGDHVAGGQQDDVAGHELLDRDIDVVMCCGSNPPTQGRVISTIRRRSSAALFERCSCMKPSETLRTTMTAIMIAAR